MWKKKQIQIITKEAKGKVFSCLVKPTLVFVNNKFKL